jgi:hypothetical protein
LERGKFKWKEILKAGLLPTLERRGKSCSYLIKKVKLSKDGKRSFSI